ncbi:hypothetical protein GCM10025762_08230 [Haloechinothrix salitolerans]
MSETVMDRFEVRQPAADDAGDIASRERPGAVIGLNLWTLVAAADNDHRAREDRGFLLDSSGVGDDGGGVLDQPKGVRVVERFSETKLVGEFSKGRDLGFVSASWGEVVVRPARAGW